MTLPQISIKEIPLSLLDTPSSLTLLTGEIHLWLTPTSRFASHRHALEILLSREEIERMERFHFQQDKQRYAVAHGLLRMLISRYVNIPPRLVHFRSSPQGKPALHSYHESGYLTFNISHSHHLLAFAFSRSYRLGVDVEYIRHMPDFQEIANHFFHPIEKSALQRFPICEREQVFFEYWTRKEAFVKATGDGLSFPLDSFYVSNDRSSRDSPIHRLYRVQCEGVGHWSVLSFNPDPCYAGALAFDTYGHVHVGHH
jgi:4'-phosphopantetheinyl transferase